MRAAVVCYVSGTLASAMQFAMQGEMIENMDERVAQGLAPARMPLPPRTISAPHDRMDPRPASEDCGQRIAFDFPAAWVPCSVHNLVLQGSIAAASFSVGLACVIYSGIVGRFNIFLLGMLAFALSCSRTTRFLQLFLVRRNAVRTRRLCVSDNSLVRTSWDWSEQAWHRSDIAEIRSELSVEQDGVLVSVVLRDLRGCQCILYIARLPARDFLRERMEVAWIATRLREALHISTAASMPAADTSAPAEGLADSIFAKEELTS